MYIALLGRQPALGMSELERLYGSARVSWRSDNAATIDTDECPDVQALGGSQKIGTIVTELTKSNWREVNTFIIQHYSQSWQASDHKKTLGISVYGLGVKERDIQKTGLELKKKLRHHGVSLRLIPNKTPELNTAVSHHNKLGLSEHRVELLVLKAANGRVIIAESRGAQNITALAARDQARPKTDAFVGMLPPKLARMMVNLTLGSRNTPATLLDPFCGTGVLPQEAMLLGHNALGSDLSEKMVDYSRENLAWLKEKYRLDTSYSVEQADAMTQTWTQPFTHVACETYLGQPFSAPPRSEKLAEVRRNCQHIVSSFLTNLHPQLPAEAELCLAVPAWRDIDGHFTHLPLTQDLQKLGYERIELTHVRPDQLLYFRPDQVVARQILLLRKK